jgi:hypothetical protein
MRDCRGDGVRPKDRSQVSGESGPAAEVRPATEERAAPLGSVQGIHGRADRGRRMERGGATAGVARARYAGGYSALKEYVQPKREEAQAVAVRRFETPPGRQAQVDWGHLGTLEMNGECYRVWGFTFTLG